MKKIMVVANSRHKVKDPRKKEIAGSSKSDDSSPSFEFITNIMRLVNQTGDMYRLLNSFR